MTTTKARDLRELSVDDLRRKEADLTDQIFRMRIQKAMGQLDQPQKIRWVRRDLARLQTVLREKQREAVAASAPAAEPARGETK